MSFFRILGLASLGSAAALAQTVQLEPVEVLAMPIVADTSIDDWAGRTTTVGRDQIDALNAQDLASALRRTPGVAITRYNPVGSFGGGEGGAILIRGLGSSRPGGEVVTLVDGVPNYNAVFNHPLLDLMSIDAAAGIEVAHRASPVAAGNLFASVNLVPPRAEGSGASAEASGQAGSFGAWSERLAAGYADAALNVYVGQSHREADGHRPDADGELNNLLLHAGWQPAAGWEVRYLLNRTDNAATDPGPAAGSGLPPTRGDRYLTENWLQALTISGTGERATGHLKAYHNQGDATWLRRTTSNNADSLNTFTLAGLRWRESLTLGAGEFVIGADYDTMRGRSVSVPPGAAPTVTFGPEEFALFSLYAGWNRTWTVDEWSFTPSVGARAYDHDEFGSETGAEVGFVVRRGAMQWHAAANRAVKFPGLDVAAFSVVAIPALGQTWRDLGPEILDQYELGWRGELGVDAALELTLFRNEGRDRYVFVPPPPPPFRYVNLETFRTEGAELALTWRPVANVSLFGAVSALRTPPADLPYAPEWTIATGMTWRLGGGWKLNVDGSYVSAQSAAAQARANGAPNLEQVGAYALLNARLAWAFARGEVFVAGENLLDRDYRYRPGYPMPGSGGSVGVRVKF
ncbi:MAG: TonB-dependent receptor [Cephaloticoccus sp.]